MSILEQALTNTISVMNETPDNIHISPPNDDGWQKILLSWNESPKKFLFEIHVDTDTDSTVACILEREVLSYNWGETFMALLYTAIDNEAGLRLSQAAYPRRS